MYDEQTQTMGLSQDGVSRGSAWTALIIVLGLSLWAQVFSVPLLDELRFRDPRALAAVIYLLPLAALLPGAVWRVSPLSLLVFPACFIPAVLLLPERSAAELEQASSMLRIGVTLAAYIAAAAAGGAPAHRVGESDPDAKREQSRVDGLYPFYFAVRGAILLGLLLVIQYAVFRDPAIAAKIAEHYDGKTESAATFIGLLSFFAWCVAAYTMFFVPMMNLEYDVRKLSRAIDQMLDGGQGARWRRVGGWFAAAAVVAALAWAL